MLDGQSPRESKIDESGRRLFFPAKTSDGWILDKSGAYAFRLTDREGFMGGDQSRWGIDVVADAAPRVAIEEPNADLFVVPRAVVPLAVSADDDLAIQKIDVAFTRSDHAGAAPQSFSLYQGPGQPPPAAAFAMAARESNRRRGNILWNLEAVQLTPGVQVTFWAVATDYKPQSAKSQPLRLSIITPEELAERIAARQAAILAELSRVLQIQRHGHEPTFVARQTGGTTSAANASRRRSTPRRGV